ncbi:hypothetical protein BU25DRAFT_491874 [Macroventuria anomochaeta]|uniref:Uncharacterized protein n=1 Tax=Macroventuria anomochaeta TaxID=301207 RepID=A0ACB6RYL1_9PLEO|nr:uncharacterized protein BU25DRAFT_491874 [Macroventuria anomochaeta]KAF2626971.1 hypothetical protein BU25DRAFT_491874 [Macroventuria anomochaeta]
MTKSNIGRQGLPVLVYLTSEPLSLSCSMRILHHEPRKQVTIALRTSVVLHGSEDEQTFVAQYDANNLLPDTTALDAATIHLPNGRHGEIARNADPRITILSLGFKQPCPLWCPPLECLSPKAEPSSVASFNELVELAKATTVHIVFDYNWLHIDLQVPFQRLVRRKEKLTGYPVEKHYAKFLRRRDWTVFGPADTATSPPAYADLSHKRLRRVSSSTSPSPPHKRKVLDESRPQTQVPSSTECTTSPPTYANDEDEHDFQSKAISRVVKRHLPAVLKQVLPKFLPTLLPTLFAIPASFSSSPDDSDSQASQSPELTPLGLSLIPHLVAHIQPQLQKMHTRALSHEERRRESAALRFEEDFEFHKAELMQIRDDGVDDLQREAMYALDEARERGRDVAEELGEDIEAALRDRGKRALNAVCSSFEKMKKKTLRESSCKTFASRTLIGFATRKYRRPQPGLSEKASTHCLRDLEPVENQSGGEDQTASESPSVSFTSGKSSWEDARADRPKPAEVVCIDPTGVW